MADGSPDKRPQLSDQYRRLNLALTDLYTTDTLLLAGKSPISFDRAKFDRAIRRLFDEKGFSPELLNTPEMREYIQETYNALDGAISGSISTETPEELTSALRENAFIFSGFKSYHAMREAGLSLTRDDGTVKSWSEFRSDVQLVDKKYNVNYLYAEYNHAVHTSQMAVKWNDFMRDGDRYNLQYRTAGDDRVREAHAALDGVTLPPSDKFWDSYLPPNGWNCRCQTVQVLRDDYQQSDSAAAVAAGESCTSEPKQQIFRYNAGKRMTVFPPKHPYLPKGCGDCGKRVSFLWGKDNPTCRACRVVVRHLVAYGRKVQFDKYRAEGVEPVRRADAAFSSGNVYFAAKDFKNLLWHCDNPTELQVATSFKSGLPALTFMGTQPLKDKSNTDKKRERGVLHYSVYQFKRKVRINGEMVEKAFELKCEVRDNGCHGIQDHPYCIRMLE